MTTPKPEAATPEEIAAGLNDRQRQLLVSLPKGWLDEYTAPPWPNIHDRADFSALGEMRPGAVFNHAWRLTPLGLSVRAILEQEQSK